MFRRICIATFSFYKNDKRTAINGMIEPLLSYFLPKAKVIDLIDGPHPGSSTVTTRFEEYKKEKNKTTYSIISRLMTPLLTMQNQNGTQIFFKLRDFLSVFGMIIRRGKTYDLFIGLESIFTLAGIIFKKLRLIKTVVYYVSDYSPKRYPQKALNDFYLWLDRFCCYNADYVWDVSPAMMPARIKAGLDENKCKPVILVPNALFQNQIHFLPEGEQKKNSVVFAGTFGIENGTKLALDAFALVVKKIPDATLHFYGGDKVLEDALKKHATVLQIEKCVLFHGFITDAVKLSTMINQYKIGLAPYVAIPGSARFYADATKIRLYFGAGLPVITTRVPPLGKDVSKKGAGIIIQDNPKDLADAIFILLTDTNKYTAMRKKAIAYAKNNMWANSYSHALSRMSFH